MGDYANAAYWECEGGEQVLKRLNEWISEKNRKIEKYINNNKYYYNKILLLQSIYLCSIYL